MKVFHYHVRPEDHANLESRATSRRHEAILGRGWATCKQAEDRNCEQAQLRGSGLAMEPHFEMAQPS